LSHGSCLSLEASFAFLSTIVVVTGLHWFTLFYSSLLLMHLPFTIEKFLASQSHCFVPTIFFYVILSTSMASSKGCSLSILKDDNDVGKLSMHAVCPRTPELPKLDMLRFWHME
jgi:hypothetical protein